jgi:CheY-like chemotaxis protein
MNSTTTALPTSPVVTRRSWAASNAREAVGRDTYALVLMDLRMPTMDGLDAIAEIRRKEQSTGRRLPIVVVTAEVLAGEKERCLAAGADGYLSKPMRSGDLEEIMGCVMRSR